MTFYNTVLFTSCLIILQNTESKAATCTTWQKEDLNGAEATEGVIHNVFNHNYYVQFKLDKSLLAKNTEPTIDLEPIVYTDSAKNLNCDGPINQPKDGLYGDNLINDNGITQLPGEIEKNTTTDSGKTIHFQIGETGDPYATRHPKLGEEENEDNVMNVDGEHQNKYVGRGKGEGNSKGMPSAGKVTYGDDLTGYDEDTVSDKGTGMYPGGRTRADFGDETGYGSGANMNGDNTANDQPNVKFSSMYDVDGTNNEEVDDDGHGIGKYIEQNNIKGRPKYYSYATNNELGNGDGHGDGNNMNGGRIITHPRNVESDARSNAEGTNNELIDDNGYTFGGNINGGRTTANGRYNVKGKPRSDADGTNDFGDDNGYTVGGKISGGRTTANGKYNVKGKPRSDADGTNEFGDDNGYTVGGNINGGRTTANGKYNVKGKPMSDADGTNEFGDDNGYKVGGNINGGRTTANGQYNVKGKPRSDADGTNDFGDDNVYTVGENINVGRTTANGQYNVKEGVRIINDRNDVNVKYGKNSIRVECMNDDYLDVDGVETAQERGKARTGLARGENRYVDEVVEDVGNREEDTIGQKPTQYGIDRERGKVNIIPGKGAIVQGGKWQDNAERQRIIQGMIRERGKGTELQTNDVRNMGDDDVMGENARLYGTVNEGMDDAKVNRGGKAKGVTMRKGKVGFRSELFDDGNEYVDDNVVPVTGIATNAMGKGEDTYGDGGEGALDDVDVGQYVGSTNVKGAHENTYANEHLKGGSISNVDKDIADNIHTNIILGKGGKAQPNDEPWYEYDEGTLNVGVSDPQPYTSSLAGSRHTTSKHNVPTGQVKLSNQPSHLSTVDTGSNFGLGNVNSPLTHNSQPQKLGSEAVREEEGLAYGEGNYDDEENTQHMTDVLHEGEQKDEHVNDQASLHNYDNPIEHPLKEDQYYDTALPPDSDIDKLKVTMWPCIAVKNRVVPFYQPIPYHIPTSKC